MTDPLLPASSATFALTLSQNVSREVEERIAALQKRTQGARAVSWVSLLAATFANAAAFVIEPALVIVSAYMTLMVLPLPPLVWWYGRRASVPALLLNQAKDVAFVGPDGLVFFGDEGFFIEKAAGWKPYGVHQPSARRFDTVEYSAHDRSLVLSSSAGYSIRVRVPPGWSELDTQRVQARLDAFTK